MPLAPWRASAALLLGFALNAAQADPAPPAVEKEIVGLTQQLMDALVPGKADVWQRLLADDALIVDEFGRRQGKKEAVDAVRGLPPGFSGNIELRDPHVHVYGEDTAVLECEWYETESVFEQKLTVRYIGTTTFVRRDGAWRVAAMMDVTLPTPPPALAVRDLPLKDYAGTYRYGPERAWYVALEQGKLVYRTKPERAPVALDPVAKDVFMSGDDEKNLVLFRRDAAGKITELIERRKFNDLHLTRAAPQT
jgi:hypothetical protein